MTTLGATPSTTELARWLPFGVYTALNPLTTTGQQPYATSVDRTITFVSYHQEVYVATTNNASNYWKIQIKRASDGALIGEVTTAAASANALQHLSTTTFSITSVGVADNSIYMSVVTVGSPGSLYMLGPMVEVTG